MGGEVLAGEGVEQLQPFIGIVAKSGLPASAVGGRGARGFLAQKMQPPHVTEASTQSRAH